jgi:hypothetical protein
MAQLLAPLLVALVPACGGGSNSGGTGGSGNLTCSGASLVAHEANDYSFASTLMFPPVAVAPNTELTFDWTAATADLIGHSVDPHRDINSVLILMWSLPLAELQTKLNADALAQRDLVVVPLTFFPDGVATTAKLLTFTLNGNPIAADVIMPYFNADTYDPVSHTYTMIAATGRTLGQGTRMIQSFKLDRASTNSTVAMTASSTTLAYTANLHNLTSTGIPARQPAITLDWGEMTTNALGNEFVATNITDALVAHFTQTPVQLEAQFLDLELIASELYRGTIPSGTVVNFASLQSAAGQTFPGIDATGTWIVALRCGGCRNPAPWYLAILKPCN